MTEEKKELVKLPIKDVKELMLLGFALGHVVKVSKEDDGKLGVNDIKNAMVLLPLVGPAMDGIEDVPAQIKDMDAEEGKELIAAASAALAGTFTDEELIVKIEKSIAVVLSVIELVKVL